MHSVIRFAMMLALLLWSGASSFATPPINPSEKVESAIRKSFAFQSEGKPDLAAEEARQAISIADQSAKPELRARARIAFAGSLIVGGQADVAIKVCEEAIAIFPQDSTERASGWNQLGVAQLALGDSAKAIAAFEQAKALSKDPVLTARAMCNLAIANQRAGQLDPVPALLDGAKQSLNSASPSVDSAWVYLTLAQINQELKRDTESYAAAEQAAGIARKENEPALSSWAQSIQAQLYENQNRPAEAMVLARRAMAEAMRIDRPDVLYRVQWQIGRIHRSLNQVNEALDAYRGSVSTLGRIRADVALGSSLLPRAGFQERVGSLYLELTDLLITRSESSINPAEEQKLLSDARNTLELRKTAELDDYFQDRCASQLRAKSKAVELSSNTTAVIYPAILPQRTVLLISIGSTIRRISIPVSRDELTTEATRFREQLEDRTTQRYLRGAKKLNDWLVAPMEPLLREMQIDTLVLVPEGVLRTIPFAALYDGKQYLGDKFALAVTPGLTLMEPRPLQQASMRVLLSGLSESVQGFPALPFVRGELKEVSRTVGARQELLNESFSVSRFSKEIRDQHYTVVHIASHGEFGHDAQSTFLLAWDERLTLDKLERAIGPSLFRGEPIELLTLSACQTASGDERAALGLAGIAIKAGARSALATLWYVNDEASAQLISEFYAQLNANPGISKAKAMQQAQRKQMNDQRYRHPYYWSGYLLIGNWL